MNINQIHKLDDSDLLDIGWRLTTNNRQSGGASVKGKAEAMRRLRKLGARFFIGGWFSTEEGQGGTTWGLLRPGEACPSGLDWCEVGVSLDHAAHKLGKGNASEGWRRYWMTV